MKRLMFSLLSLCVGVAAADAHFVYLVPGPDGKTATVVFSEDLKPDSEVPIEKIAQLKLNTLSADGKQAVVPCQVGEHKLTAQFADNVKVASGTVTYGLMSKGASPSLLVYHPKAVWPGVDSKTATVGSALEIVPVRGETGTRFQLLAAGKPVANAAGTVLLPDETDQKVTTDAKGFTQAFPKPGRYGIWLRHIEAKTGESNGKKYTEIKHYATLVADVTRPAIPTPASSLGAIADGETIYIYGGHAGKTHGYDTKAVIGSFYRLKPNGQWETLPGGPILQGMNLAAHNGKIYRVGGMTARNAPGTASDIISLTDAARFDPAAGQWQALPPLPAGRSSHDLVVVGDKLVVVGGWQLKGQGADPEWPQTALVMDLNHTPLEWKTVAQPFTRRALTAAAVGSKVYVIAGLDADAKQQTRVDVYDVDANTWSEGPALPNGRTGFSPAATVVDGRVIVSTSDGKLHRLNSAGNAWETLNVQTSKRRVHRLVPVEGGVLLIGGAGSGGNYGEMEFVAVPKS